jgi:hypothetical protein
MSHAQQQHSQNLPVGSSPSPAAAAAVWL